MHTIKPLQLSLTHKTFVWDDKPRFVVSIMLGFPFDGGQPVLEPDLWSFLAETLGKDAVVDMGMPKPRGEVLAFGSFFAPGGTPVSAARVELQVGALRKELAVIGDRYWRTLLGPSEPLPFSQMPITYERAFGGAGFARNPTGKGLAEVDVYGEMRLPLPNIEDPRHLLTAAGQRPDPAGFGPLDVMWESRAAKLGTYDDKWLQQRAPGYAEDLDWTHFNAAPPDQWLDGFFTGDESFSLHYMHPEKSQVAGRLPAQRIRCFVNRRVLGELRFEEIETRAESVFLFPAEETGMVLYRGTIDIDQDDASDIEHLVLGYENLGDAPRSRDHYAQALAHRLDPDTQLKYAMTTVDLIADGHICGFARLVSDVRPTAGALAENLQAKAASVREEVAGKLEQMRDSLAEQLHAAGIDPAPYLDKMRLDADVPVDDPLLAGLMQLLEQLLPGITTDPANLDLQKLDLSKFADIEEKLQEIAAAKKAEVKQELQRQLDDLERQPQAKPAADGLRDSIAQLDEPPPLPRGPGPEIADQIREQSSQFDEMSERLRTQGVAETHLPKPGIDVTELEAQMSEADAQFKDAYRMGSHRFETGRPPHTVPLDIVAHRLLKKIEKGESTADADYAGIDLSGCKLRGVDLSGCYLEDVNFAGADLSDAKLVGANAARADFSGARLVGANLDQANVGACRLQGADLSDASLVGAVLGKSVLAGARLHRANLADISDFLEVDFADADLSGARFHAATFLELEMRGAHFSGASMSNLVFIKCRLPSAVFTEADLEGSTFVECDLSGAIFERSRLVNVRFVGGCNLAKAKFDGANLDRSNLREADLSGASFRRASINMTDFGAANLQRSNFTGAVGLRAQFIKADLAQAEFSSANLMEANLMKARMTSARFDHANLYSAEVLGATVGGTSFAMANLDLTKIEHWRPD